MALKYGGQFIGNAQTKEEGVKLRRQLPEVEALDELLTELIHMRENWSKLSITERNQAISSSTFAKLASKGEAGFALGVLAGPDLDLIHGAIPENPNATLQPGQIARLKQTRKNFRSKAQKVVSQHSNVVIPWYADEVRSNK